MTTKTLYFDEAGFTGSNLLDPDQPVFAIASSDLADDEALDILQYCFPHYQGIEYKFTNIWRSSKHRDGLVRFGERFRALNDRAFVYAVDKRYAVLTKAVDFLIEPVITDSGYDFYNDGFCWRYCNYIYCVLTEVAGPALLNAIVSAYQAFSRSPSRETLAHLQWRLSVIAQSIEGIPKILVEQLSYGAEMFDHFHDIDSFHGSDELQTTCMVAIVAYWRGLHTKDFEIVHDASSNFMRHKEMWDRITNHNVPRQMVRTGDGTMVEYPLRVASTTPIDSRNSVAIQFCDVLAGLTTKQLNPVVSEADRKILDHVIEAGLSELTLNGIRPASEFPIQIPPRRLDGADVVDQMTEIIFGAHHAARPDRP